MVARISKCDEQALQSILSSNVEIDEGSDFLLHLESCAHCQSKMEQLAADESMWTGVQCLDDDRGAPDQTALFAPIDSVQSTAPRKMGTTRSESNDSPKRLTNEPEKDEAFGALNDAAILSFLAPSEHEHSLGRMDEYEIEKVIGRGGMGVVLLALDRSLERRVAIKVLSPHLATSGAARERFQREARAAAAVVHEHVVAIHGVRSTNGLPYIVMPYISGPSLQSYVDDNGPLEVEHALRIAMQIAMGLEAAHRQGLVHRDVKPANVLMDHGVDRVMLTDFGLARAADDASLTRTGVIAGTPHYMSPEQASGGIVDARSDLYGLGSVLYFMLTGRPPFRAESTLAVLERIRRENARSLRSINASVPEWLDRFVERLHEKKPASRMHTANDVVTLIGRCLSYLQEPTRERRPRISTTQSRARRRFQLILATAACAFILASVVLVVRPFESLLTPAERFDHTAQEDRGLENAAPFSQTTKQSLQSDQSNSEVNRESVASQGESQIVQETIEISNTTQSVSIDEQIQELDMSISVFQDELRSERPSMSLPFQADPVWQWQATEIDQLLWLLEVESMQPEEDE